MSRKIRMGMIGGGEGSFIGAVHRMAANLDGQIELVAGCFSSKSETNALSGENLFIAPNRVYSDFESMAKGESMLPENKRIDFVSIVTPNHLHYAPAMAFLKHGFHVVCDKPMTFTLKEALELRNAAKKSKKLFMLTHNYSGYPMIQEARDQVKKGTLGKILKIVVEYSQGWLLKRIESEGQKQATWRTDPKKAGISCCIGDIGTHGEHLARFVTGLEIESLCADLTTFISGRALEDDGNVLLRYKGGAKGVLISSQIMAGEENNLVLRVYGEKASMEWHQEHPNELTLKYSDQPRQILRRGNSYISDAAKDYTRIPFGHPEAFLEAFANLYQSMGRAIRKTKSKNSLPLRDFPGVDDGVQGMAFIKAVVDSSKSTKKWTKLPKT